MATRKDKLKKKKVEEEKFELLFIFKYVCVNCEMNDELDEETQAQVNNALKLLTKEIHIDKSYVDFEGTKYKKTFLREDGWKELCDLVFKTKFGNKCKKDDNDRMLEAYRSIIVCYLYQALSDLGFDIENIYLEIADRSKFMVEFHKDVCEEWKTYVGPWQNWKSK